MSTLGSQPATRGEATRRAPVLPRHVVVKFADDVPWPYADGIESRFDQGLRRRWSALPLAGGGVPLLRLFRSLEPAHVDALGARARELTGEPAPRLSTYYRVECPDERTGLEVVDTIKDWPEVEAVYLEGLPLRRVAPPRLVPDVGLLTDLVMIYPQGYLESAPKGIGLWDVIAYPGVDGAGVRVADVEAGWNFTHVDLPQGPPIQMAGPPLAWNNPDWAWHGNAVLGILVALDDGQGCVGIVPAATALPVSEYQLNLGRAGTPGGPFIGQSPVIDSRADAVAFALSILGPGDILLLETTATPPWDPLQYPIEIEFACYDAIRTATMGGITVVEAAGNAVKDLDAAAAGVPRLADRLDSGAILVAAGMYVQGKGGWGFDRYPSSNYGSRVDCFAWGYQVNTLAADSTGYQEFDGTSGAAAIIAGVAAAVQGMVRASGGAPLTPQRMRELLRDRTLGTLARGPVPPHPPALGDAPQGIGAMPDLAKLAAAILPTCDVYLRRFVGDTGMLIPTRPGSCPDIIVRRQEPASPSAAFGEGSDTVDSMATCDEVVAGEVHHVYVRCRNRGVQPAAAVGVRVYRAPVATIPTPDLWTPLGGPAPLASVPPGRILAVSDGLVWRPGADGPHCLVAVLDAPDDPAPDLSHPATWVRFLDMTRLRNNVAWRNWHVARPGSPLPPTGRPQYQLPFLLTSAPDRSCPMTLEVQADLPAGAYARFVCDAGETIAGLPDSAGPESASYAVFTGLPLPPGLRLPCHLEVALPSSSVLGPLEVVVRQIHARHEVGRITWVLAP